MLKRWGHNNRCPREDVLDDKGPRRATSNGSRWGRSTWRKRPRGFGYGNPPDGRMTRPLPRRKTQNEESWTHACVSRDPNVARNTAGKPRRPWKKTFAVSRGGRQRGRRGARAPPAAAERGCDGRTSSAKATVPGHRPRSRRAPSPGTAPRPGAGAGGREGVSGCPGTAAVRAERLTPLQVRAPTCLSWETSLPVPPFHVGDGERKRTLPGEGESAGL